MPAEEREQLTGITDLVGSTYGLPPGQLPVSLPDE